MWRQPLTRQWSNSGALTWSLNNAGIIGAVGSIVKTSRSHWDRTISVLLTGAFLGIKQAARVMMPQGSGSIISTASVAGFVAGLGPHAYTAAKHAVIGLTKSASSELAAHGVRVNAIAPGSVATAMTAGTISSQHYDRMTTVMQSWSPLGITGMPVDIAMAAVYLASDESRYMSGHTLIVDGGQLAGGVASSSFFHDRDPELITGIANEQPPPTLSLVPSLPDD